MPGATRGRRTKIVIEPIIHVKRQAIPRGATIKELCWHIHVGGHWDRVHYSTLDGAAAALTGLIAPLLTGNMGTARSEPTARPQLAALRAADLAERERWSALLGRPIADDEPMG